VTSTLVERAGRTRPRPERYDSAGDGGVSTLRHDGLVVVATYLAIRVVCLASFGLGSRIPGARSVLGVLDGHDGRWYIDIAQHGYVTSVPAGTGFVAQTNLAFFPLYPMVLRALHTVGLPYAVAGQAVDVVVGSLAVLLVLRVLRHLAPPETAATTVLLWCFWPAAYVLSLTYSEPLFLALSAGCLLALLQQRWALAGVLALLGSATRPTGLVLALACLVAAVSAARRGEGLRPWVAVLLAPWGALAFAAYLIRHTGSLSSYSRTEKDGWGTAFDGGTSTFSQAFRAVLHPGVRPPDLAVVAFIVVALVLLGLLLKDGLPAPVLAYTIGLLVLAVTGGKGTYSSIPRLLLPAFPLLLPLAARIRRYAPAALTPVIGASALLVGASAVVITASEVIIP